ncbi:hypothetical protein ACFXO2_37095 [Streptomyces sp. NPDC059152]|uniref:hypothetical protein n=1 Tax=Streptomyces sp. NPDC059152 TaxID=3346742 RepID=UPI0036982161
MRHILVFDTETTTDTVQNLNFGAFRIYELDYEGQILTLIEEGIFYQDDLPERDPAGFATLREYAASHTAPIDHRILSISVAVRKLHFLSRTEFVEHYLWRRAYRYRMGVVGFNLPFDISRIAIDVGAARGFYDGGFSFKLWEDNDRWRPRLRVKHLDSKKSFIGWGTTPEHKWRGLFIDCRTLAFGLTSTPHSLESACRAFGVEGKTPVTEHGVITPEYIDYCREDVAATGRLFDAMLREFYKHPIPKLAHQVYSPATLAKGYFEAMGITPHMGRSSVPDDVLGFTMSTFYGGRAEARIRRVHVPVTVLDFTSMYPTVGHLMGLWDLITSADIQADEFDLDLSNVDVDYCLNPDNWPDFVGIAQVWPEKDVLPVRTHYGPDETPNIGINYFSATEPHWYAIPDVIASTILTGKAPKILKAYRFTSAGRAPSLQPVSLLGRIAVSPEEDFFKYAVEERQRVKNSDPQLAALLKTVVNSGSYGIFAQVNRKKFAQPTPGKLLHRSGVTQRVSTTKETPGEYCYPPLATMPTSGARLMLALMERIVMDAGGYYAFMDTDSCAVTGADPDAIIERFDALNPYDRDLVPHILKREFDGYAYVISAKRYVLTDAAGTIVKSSEHGLGYLMAPEKGKHKAWIEKLWRAILDDEEPEWGPLPALMPHSVSSWNLYYAFRTLNEKKPYSQQMKPFNFMMIGQVQPMYRRPEGGMLIAPYEADSTQWGHVTWVDRNNPIKPHKRPPLVNFQDVIDDYAVHPEWKLEDLNGQLCVPPTRGILRRQWIHAPSATTIGKESNSLEGTELLEAEGIATVLFGKTWEDWFPLVDFFLDRCAENRVASRTQVKQYRKGSKPRPKKMKEIIQASALYAWQDLRKEHADSILNLDPLHVLQTWYHLHHGDPDMPI